MVLKPYHRLEEGCGGIFEFPVLDDVSEHNHQLYAIGTIGCDTCVGIYFSLGKKRCFAAHIFPCILDVDGDLPLEGECTKYIPNNQQGQQLSQKIKSLFEKEFLEFDKSMVSRLIRDAIVVCPRTEESELKAVGYYVLQGIEQYCEGQLTVNEHAHGFAIDHTSGHRRLFEIGTTKDSMDFQADMLLSRGIVQLAEERYGWTAVNPEYDEKANKAWKLTYFQGEWHVADGEETNDKGSFQYDEIEIDEDDEAITIAQ